jgi:hypothetical protein
MDAAAMRSIYAEHVLHEGANASFSPPNNPNLVCSPEREFFFVVGEDGIDITKWEVKPGARPANYDGCMVEGRNATPLSELLEADEAKRAGLRDTEVIALRLYAGPMHHVYNKILRNLGSQEDLATANLYPTTIQLIVSGIRKLGAIAKIPEGGAVFRGLSGFALPPEFFEPDEQGFAGGVEASFMSTTLSEEVARKYSGVNEGREATIFRLELGKTSIGADISWLSQFAGEREMVFPPRTHLQVVGEPFRGDDGVSVVTLLPTAFQNVRTVDEVEKARREDMKQLASSLVWDIRNAAAQEGLLDLALTQRLDALEQKLLADHCSQEPGFYNDNMRYKSQFQLLLRDAAVAREKVRDSTSFLSRTLAIQHGQASEQDSSIVSAPPVTVLDSHVPGSSNEVSALHSKFTQDPNFKGVRGRFGADKLFAAGIDAIVGPMDVQYVRAMHNEHCLVSGASQRFTTFEGLGSPMETTPEREWLFVVGSAGLDRKTWTFDIAGAEPVVEQGMMVQGRNAKNLSVLMDSPKAKRASLSAAEVVALRLYTGPMYLKYNAVLRGMAGATAGGTSYCNTIHLISSGLRKLSRVSEPPAGMLLYRGNGGMALPSSFLEPDEQVCVFVRQCVCACVRALVRK